MALGGIFTLVVATGGAAAGVEHVAGGPVVAEQTQTREAVTPRRGAVSVHAPHGTAGCNQTTPLFNYQKGKKVAEPNVA